MKLKSGFTSKEIIRHVTGWLAFVFLLVGVFAAASRALASTDTGYVDFSYSGTSAPTGQKAQDKLWFNDGIWWGSLFNSSSKHFEIYRFNWATDTWATTGTLIDSRSKSEGDALWDGSHLYVMSSVPPGTSGDTSIRLMRYTYNAVTKTYSVDTGFPVAIVGVPVDFVTMDKDTLGNLWMTYTYNVTSTTRNVFVSHTTTDDLTWITPYVIPLTGADNLGGSGDYLDISAIVSFNGKIGVMWSNQNTDTMYFGIHVDGDPDSAWTANPALQGPHYIDDHINLKSLSADASGQVYAVMKTSLNDVNPSTSTQPLILLLRLDNTGSWTRRTVWEVVDDFTRPIVLLDTQNREIYAIAAEEYPGQTSGAIYEKQIPLDDPGAQFPTGLGTPLIVFSAYTHINNPSSTKQNLNSSTGLLVIAGDDNAHLYFHNKIALGAVQATPTNTATSTPTATATSAPIDTPTDTPISVPTDTPTSAPTATATSAPIDTPTDTPISVPTDTPTSAPTATATSAPAATNTPTPTPSSSVILFSDGFESGNFSAWSLVKTGGDGVALVQSTTVKTGNFAAQLSETANTGSLAYIRASLSQPVTGLTVGLDIQISQEGVSGANVPILRLFDPTGARLISLYRQNQSGNHVYIGYGGTNYSTTGLLPLGTWSHFDVHVITAGTGASTVQVYQDGTLIYQTTTASLGTAGVLTAQVGNETAKQTFTLFADNVQISQ